MYPANCLFKITPSNQLNPYRNPLAPQLNQPSTLLEMRSIVREVTSRIEPVVDEWVWWTVLKELLWLVTPSIRSGISKYSVVRRHCLSPTGSHAVNWHWLWFASLVCASVGRLVFLLLCRLCLLLLGWRCQPVTTRSWPSVHFSFGALKKKNEIWTREEKMDYHRFRWTEIISLFLVLLHVMEECARAVLVKD